MPKQLPLKFWDKERTTLAAVLLPHVRASALDGAAYAGEELERVIGLGVDFDPVNEAVSTWAREYTFDLVRGITETTAEFVGKEIAAWVESGQPLPVLTEALTPLFDESRAERIAVTEVTRSYAEGNTTAWKESGYVAKRQWMTAEDEIVCPICGALDGEVADLGTPFEADGEMYDNPPAHVSCRCYLQPVIAETEDA